MLRNSLFFFDCIWQPFVVMISGCFLLGRFFRFFEAKKVATLTTFATYYILIRYDIKSFTTFHNILLAFF